MSESKEKTMDQLKELIERAILVAYWRNGDIDTEDGTFATTDTDEMIRLESAIQELMGFEASELYRSSNPERVIEKKLNEIKAEAVMYFANSMVGAYETGFIDRHESNLAGVYQCAKAHVEINYKVKCPNIDEAWGKDVADWCKNGVPTKPDIDNSSINQQSIKAKKAMNDEMPEVLEALRTAIQNAEPFGLLRTEDGTVITGVVESEQGIMLVKE